MSNTTVEKENILSQFQLFAIITRIMQGGVLFGVYREVAEKAGRDAWISFVMASLPIIMITIVIHTLNKRFPGHTFVEYTEVIFGKWLGKLFGGSLVLFFIFISGLFLRLFSEMVSIWLLPRTPLMVIIIIIILLTVYLTRNGLLVLGRFCTIITFIVFPLRLLIFIALPDWMITNLLPVGTAGFTDILSGSLPAIAAYGGYEILLMLYPYIQNKRHVLRTTLISLIYSMSAYISIMLTLILYFGPGELRFPLFPPLVYLTTVEIPVIERMDVFAFFFGMFSLIASLGVLYMFASLGVSQLLGLKKRKNVSIFLAPLVAGVALSPKDITALMNMGHFLGLLNMLVGMGLPAVCLILAVLLKRKKEVSNEKAT